MAVSGCGMVATAEEGGYGQQHHQHHVRSRKAYHQPAQRHPRDADEHHQPGAKAVGQPTRRQLGEPAGNGKD